MSKTKLITLVAVLAGTIFLLRQFGWHRFPFAQGLTTQKTKEGNILQEGKITFPYKEMERAFSSLWIRLIDEPPYIIDFTLEDLQGKKINTKDFRGNFLWINFWATWCPPCREEMPGMQKLWEEFGEKNFTILAVNLREDKRQVQSFMEDNGYTIPVLLDKTGNIGATYRVRGIPAHYFVNPEGRIVGVAVGARDWENENFYSFLRELSNY